MTPSWLATTFEKYPALAVFRVIGVGDPVGGFTFRGFGLGPVTGSLVAGSVPGHSGTATVGHTLLTTWGPVIVWLPAAAPG